MKEIQQSKRWEEDFGKQYTDRNPQSFEELDNLYMKNFGISRTELNKQFLGNSPKNIKILEIGSNIGMQLIGLQKLGFNNLTGIEISDYAIEQAKKLTTGINFIKASALNLPFEDKSFDLVFTSGVLIHIHPKDLNKVIDEIYRTSSKYMWCYEYFSENCQELVYRGNKNLLWKNNFAKLFLEKYSDLKLIKEKKIKYLDSGNIDQMFLLEK